MKYVVLYSGGPDSFITYHWAKAAKDCTEVIPVYFDFGHRYASRERAALISTLPDTKLDISLNSLGALEDKDAYIHARNAHLLFGAVKYLKGGPGCLCLAVQKDELAIPDRTPGFLISMETVLTRFVENGDVTVPMPWLDKDKTDMVEWYLANGGSKEDLLATTSCYSSVKTSAYDRQCGDCAACVRRFIAFSLNDLDEVYETDPKTSTIGKLYVDRARTGYYSELRSGRILSALGE